MAPADHVIARDRHRCGGRILFWVSLLNLLLSKKLELTLCLYSLFEDYLRAKLKTLKFYVWWQEDKFNVELMQNP